MRNKNQAGFRRGNQEPAKRGSWLRQKVNEGLPEAINKKTYRTEKTEIKTGTAGEETGWQNRKRA